MYKYLADVQELWRGVYGTSDIFGYSSHIAGGKNGYITVTCPSWLTDERPTELEKFWVDAVQGLGTVWENIATMQKAGYEFIASFVLPEKCWTDNYFIPRETAEKALLKKYAGNKLVEDYVKDEKYEVELYSKYKSYYGYVFYIGKKVQPKARRVVF